MHLEFEMSSEELRGSVIAEVSGLGYRTSSDRAERARRHTVVVWEIQEAMAPVVTEAVFKVDPGARLIPLYQAAPVRTRVIRSAGP